MIMCKGDMQLGSGCGKCVRCKEQIDTLNPEMCSCGARYKNKCVEESTSGYGKMCVKELKEEKK